MTAIIPQGEFTPTSFHPDCTSFEQWMEVGRTLRELHNSVLWWVGDWLQYGRGAYGEMYSQAVDDTGYSYDMLAKAAAVSAFYEFRTRVHSVSWTHYRIAMRTSDADGWLSRAEQEGWSSRRLTEEITWSESTLVIPDQETERIQEVPQVQIPEVPILVADVSAETVDSLECWMRGRVGQVWIEDDVFRILKCIGGAC